MDLGHSTDPSVLTVSTWSAGDSSLSGVSTGSVCTFDETTLYHIEQVVRDVEALLGGLEDSTTSRTHFSAGALASLSDDDEVFDDVMDPSHLDVPVEAIVQWCDLPHTDMEHTLESLKLYVSGDVDNILDILPRGVHQTQDKCK